MSENKDYTKLMEEVFKRCLEIFKERNQFYGNSFENQELVNIKGSTGIFVRLGDKIRRLRSLLSQEYDPQDNKAMFKNAVRTIDTCHDMINYLGIAILLIIDETNCNLEKVLDSKREEVE